MITQVIDQSNECYLHAYNKGFSLQVMQTTQTLAGRLQFARERRGLSQAQLAELAKVSQVTIAHIESGRNQSSKKLFDLAAALRVPAEWLATGARDNEVKGALLDIDLDEPRAGSQEIELIGMMSPWDDSTPLAGDEVAIPLYKEVELSGGNGATEVIEAPGRLLRFARSTLREAGVDPKDAACATLRGRSMERLIMDGATIGIDKGSTAIEDGEIYAFDHDGMLRVKYLYRMPGGGLRIRSENDDEFPDEHLTAEEAQRVRILGWVFWWSTVRRKRGLRLAK